MAIIACAKKSDLITCKEAIKILGVSQTSFYKIRKQHGFPSFIKDYKNKHIDCFKRETVPIKYKRKEIEEWMLLNPIKQN